MLGGGGGKKRPKKPKSDEAKVDISKGLGNAVATGVNGSANKEPRDNVQMTPAVNGGGWVNPNQK